MDQMNLSPSAPFKISISTAAATWMLLAVVSLLLQASLSSSNGTSSNPIDNCWRRDVKWAQNRKKLADCAVGFGSAAYGGKGGEIYTVTTPNDNPTNPLPGSLRYGVTRKRPLWIVFARDMNIKLQMPLFVTRHKTIDGRGASVHISNGPCIRLWNVSNVIIHGLHIHDCKPNVPGNVLLTEMAPYGTSGVEMIESQDGDGISVVTCRDIWIDHNTFSNCADGLVDVTLASTAVTISNNRFSHHDKVMLLGHSDEYAADKTMKVTVTYNHFGPGLTQRMPRCRYGYVHVANNNYEEWGIYAIGGSMHPTIRSEGNRFVAPREEYKKQVSWREGCYSAASCATGTWLWKSVSDMFVNGAYFVPSGRGKALPMYKVGESFKVGNGKLVPKMTQDAGALACIPSKRCG